jgi:hypothetical protein
MQKSPFLIGQRLACASEDELIDRDVNFKSLTTIDSLFSHSTHRITNIGFYDDEWHVTIPGEFSMQLQGRPSNTYPARWFNAI